MKIIRKMAQEFHTTLNGYCTGVMKMNEQPSYYSIITANVRYDNRLTDSEKLLFAEITSLSNKYGYCTATNSYFARLYEVVKETISRRISNLNKYGYLKIEIIKIVIK